MNNSSQNNQANDPNLTKVEFKVQYTDGELSTEVKFLTFHELSKLEKEMKTWERKEKNKTITYSKSIDDMEAMSDGVTYTNTVFKKN